MGALSGPWARFQRNRARRYSQYSGCMALELLVLHSQAVSFRQQAWWPSSADRRAKIRFPLTLDVDYRASGREYERGAGQTVNISSAGVLFIGQHEFATGMRIELNAYWPVPLDGAIPLQLRIRGTVVRVTENQIAITIDRHEFRTVRRSAVPEAIRPSKSHLAG